MAGGKVLILNEQRATPPSARRQHGLCANKRLGWFSGTTIAALPGPGAVGWSRTGSAVRFFLRTLWSLIGATTRLAVSAGHELCLVASIRRAATLGHGKTRNSPRWSARWSVSLAIMIILLGCSRACVVQALAEGPGASALIARRFQARWSWNLDCARESKRDGCHNLRCSVWLFGVLVAANSLALFCD